MERFINRFLVQWALLCLGKKSFIDISIVSAKCRADNFIRNIETIDDANGVWSNFRQTLFQSRLQFLHISIAKSGKLKRKQSIFEVNWIIKQASIDYLTLSRSPMHFMHVSIAYNSINCLMTADSSRDHFFSKSFVDSYAERTRNARQCASAHCTSSIPVAFVACSMLMPRRLRCSKC